MMSILENSKSWIRYDIERIQRSRVAYTYAMRHRLFRRMAEWWMKTAAESFGSASKGSSPLSLIVLRECWVIFWGERLGSSNVQSEARVIERLLASCYNVVHCDLDHHVPEKLEAHVFRSVGRERKIWSYPTILMIFSWCSLHSSNTSSTASAWEVQAFFHVRNTFAITRQIDESEPVQFITY